MGWTVSSCYSSGLAPSATASSLEFGSDYKLFSSCNTAGDLVTGKVIDFLHSPSHCSRKNTTRLQKLHGTNCLMEVQKMTSACLILEKTLLFGHWL